MKHPAGSPLTIKVVNISPSRGVGAFMFRRAQQEQSKLAPSEHGKAVVTPKNDPPGWGDLSLLHPESFPARSEFRSAHTVLDIAFLI